MTKKEILHRVYQGLAKHHQVPTEVYRSSENQIFVSDKHFFEIESFGSANIIYCHRSIESWCQEHLMAMDPSRAMDEPMLYEINRMLEGHGYRLAGEHLRFLYLQEKFLEGPKGYEYRLYEGDALKTIEENDAFSNAMNFKSDVIAYGALFEGQMVALAGADDYMGDLWQIGIDTLPGHRGKGLARYLVNHLTNCIVERSKVPYYTTWSPNLPSMNVALSAGYRPAWIGYYGEKTDKVKAWLNE